MNTEKSHRIGPESDETRRPDGNLTERERAMLLAVRLWETDHQHGGRPWTNEKAAARRRVVE